MDNKQDNAKYRRGVKVLNSEGGSQARLAGQPFGAYATWRYECQLQEGFTVAAASNQLRILQNHFFPDIGSIPVGAISTESLNELFENLEDKFTQDTSYAYCSHCRDVFERALRRGALTVNPAAVAMTGKVAVNRPPVVKIISESELTQLEACAGVEALLVLTLVAQTRCSGRELCALCWEDVDLVTGNISFPFALDGTKVVEQARPARARTVQLDARAINLLTSWKVMTAHLKSPLVFCSPRNGRFSPPRFNLMLVSLQLQAGFPSDPDKKRKSRKPGEVVSTKYGGYQAPYSTEQIGNIAVVRAYLAKKSELEILALIGSSSSQSLKKFKSHFDHLNRLASKRNLAQQLTGAHP